MALTNRGSTQDNTGQENSGQPPEGGQAGPEKVNPEAVTQSPFEDQTSGTYGDILRHPQFRRWGLRIGIALVIGIVFALVFDPRVGFTVAVLAAIADTIRQARTHSSVEAWRKASAAERRTEKQLRGLEKAGYRVFHARAVPRDEDGVSDGRIDHLVIGPTGVFAIDSEKWDKRLPVRTLSHRKLFHGPFDRKERLDEARWEADQASKMISAQVGFEVPVQPSVAIYGPAIPWKVMTVRDVDVYSGGRARAYLKRRDKYLTGPDVDRIADAAAEALPAVYE